MEAMGWVSSHVSEVIAPWVVMLPQPNQVKSNQIKVWLCPYISKDVQGYTSSSGYRANASAEWKMANSHDVTRNSDAIISTRTEQRKRSRVGISLLFHSPLTF